MTGDDDGPAPATPAVWDLRNLVGDLADRGPAVPPTVQADATVGDGSAATSDGTTVGGGAATGVAPRSGNEPVVGADSGLVGGLLAGVGSAQGIGPGGALPRIARLAGVMVLVALAVSAAVVLAAGEGSDGGADPAAEVAGPDAAEPTGWRATEAGPAASGWTEAPAEPGSTDTPASGWTTAPAGSESTAGAEAAALAALHELRLGDQPLIRLDGRYAAQLASKSVGIVDPRQVAANGSHTFHAVDILAEHRRIRAETAREAPVVLLLSTDVGKRQLYRGQPLWITVALVAADRPADVVAWCAERFPELTGAALTNRCLPRRLEP
ncbi:hypothetical protein AAH979_03785 [Plantactinospora sp. ZYX-F-223]|uniref:hypothetical protein n=1 Tax=Plantactinospora sp. ZYX-F-223 TaxID=3144103 RepID=UPI0031FCC972